MTAFNNIKEGLFQTRIDFNGFDELINRDNATIKIVDRYENMDPGGIDSTWTTLEIGKYMTSFFYVEFTLSYEPILNNLNSIEKSELLKISLNKYESKVMNNYSDPSLITTIFLISNLLYDLNYPPFIEFLDQNPELPSFVNGFLNRLFVVYEGNIIINHAKNYLAN